MVDSLVRLQVIVTQHVIDLVSVDPENIPVVALDLTVPLLPQGVEHTVSETGPELDGRVVRGVVLLLNILSKVLRHLLFVFKYQYINLVIQYTY